MTALYILLSALVGAVLGWLAGYRRGHEDGHSDCAETMRKVYPTRRAQR